RTIHTNIGVSERHCTSAGQTSASQALKVEGVLRVSRKTYNSSRGLACNVLTGCVNSKTVDRLNPNDSRGQYDFSGGAGGRRAFLKKVYALRYKHYVELIESAGPRACIRCCNDPIDCPGPTHKGQHDPSQ
ncbi:hypothetical protein C8J56DRAFT_771119, partial [Mycena floridula]